MGHYGIEPTVARIQEQHWWKDMYTDVKDYICNCKQCKTFGDDKGTTKVKSKKGNIQANYLWQKLGIDFVGPLPDTPRGNRFILVITDYLSKRAEAIPTPDKSASTVATAVFENVISQ